MIGVVVVGHNKFAQGVTSTVEMIAGKQDNYKVVDFIEGTNPDDLFEMIDAAVNEVNQGSGVLIFTDLKGGTPFQKSVMVAMSHDGVEVLTGTNIAMLLEGVLMRTFEESTEELARKLVETGMSQIDRFDAASLVREENESDEDGI